MAFSSSYNLYKNLLKTPVLPPKNTIKWKKKKEITCLFVNKCGQ